MACELVRGGVADKLPTLRPQKASHHSSMAGITTLIWQATNPLQASHLQRGGRRSNVAGITFGASP